MLAFLHREIEKEAAFCSLRLTVGESGEDVSFSRAFPCGTRLILTAEVPRRLGVGGVALRLWPDGGKSADFSFAFEKTDYITDRYTLSLTLGPAFCGVPNEADADGLFCFRLIFCRGVDTLFSHSEDGVHFSPAEREDEAEPFYLTVYRRDFETPAWLGRGTMYHIFVDRFCRGAGPVSNPDGARLNEDWRAGIPEYAAKPGDPLDNHTVFGGNLWGVIQKLPYLQSLGVTVLYLSPIFRAYSNHKYDTGDYETVDGMFGGDEALRALLDAARAHGMAVMLDGVFNHTGDDSRYFNRRGTYPEVGAYQSEASPYASWFTFRHFPNEYDCWWNIPIMPRLNHAEASCRRYFTDPETGIAARYCRMGVAGWRLDVADELSDEFLDEFRASVMQNTDGRGAVLGEVWENAATKVSYGHRRRYLRGRQLDSVMNYPGREAIIAFVRDGDESLFVRTVTELYAHYPAPVCRDLMNILGTHDTARILTVLGGDDEGERTNAQLSRAHMTPRARRAAMDRLMIASTLQYTLFGIPSLYYGDEAGVEGYRDPFCRKPFPWGRESRLLLAHYRKLGQMRLSHPALQGGSFRFVRSAPAFIMYERRKGDDCLMVAANCGQEACAVLLEGAWQEILSGQSGENGTMLAPGRAAVYVLKKEEEGGGR